MSLLSIFMDKSLSILRLGKAWFSRMIASVVEAGRTISYVETVNPSQSDTFHNSIKQSEARIFKHEFEKSVRLAIGSLRLGMIKAAIDVTEEPYWGKNGLGNTRTKVHEKSDESWQYINLSIVYPRFIPLMSLPYRQVDNLNLLTIDLLEYLKSLPLRIKLVLFDRGFYHAELIDYLENRRGGKPLPYLMFIPRTDAVKEYLKLTGGYLSVFKHQMNYSKKKSKWRPITKIVICKGVDCDKEGKPMDWCFATNQRATILLVRTYKQRWNIETGFRIHDEARIKSKSSHPLIRYFYHLIGMLIILMWRLRNYFEGHMVFKRFLKWIELKYAEPTEDPPCKC